MNFLNIFKQRQSTSTSNVLIAGAILYPDKILITTDDRVKEGFGISSTKITILPSNTASELLGSTLQYHLKLTEPDMKIPKDYKKHYVDFLKAAGFKNAKEHHKDALYLTIYQKDNTITISPTKNGGARGKQRGFVHIKGADIILSNDTSEKDLGDNLKIAWTKCV